MGEACKIPRSTRSAARPQQAHRPGPGWALAHRRWPQHAACRSPRGARLGRRARRHLEEVSCQPPRPRPRRGPRGAGSSAPARRRSQAIELAEAGGAALGRAEAGGAGQRRRPQGTPQSQAPSQRRTAHGSRPARKRDKRASHASAHLLTWRPDLGGLVLRRAGRGGAKPPAQRRALHHGGAPLPAIGGATLGVDRLFAGGKRPLPAAGRAAGAAPLGRSGLPTRGTARGTPVLSRPHIMALGAVRRAVLAARPVVQARWLALHAVKVPSLGDSVPNGSILTLTKSPGDQVAVDDVLLVIETDKVRASARARREARRLPCSWLRPREPAGRLVSGVAAMLASTKLARAVRAPARAWRWEAPNAAPPARVPVLRALAARCGWTPMRAVLWMWCGHGCQPGRARTPARASVCAAGAGQLFARHPSPWRC